MTNSRTAYIGDAFDFLSNPIAFGISPSFLIAIAVMIVAQLVLTRTVFGRYLIGIGAFMVRRNTHDGVECRREQRHDFIGLLVARDADDQDPVA